MMTILALDKTIAEARLLTDEDIVASFQGALAYEPGCPLAGVQALHKAREQYEKTIKSHLVMGGGYGHF